MVKLAFSGPQRERGFEKLKKCILAQKISLVHLQKKKIVDRIHNR